MQRPQTGVPGLFTVDLQEHGAWNAEKLLPIAHLESSVWRATHARYDMGSKCFAKKKYQTDGADFSTIAIEEVSQP